MKVVYIIPQLGCGGAETLLSTISIEMVAKRHEVNIICLKPHHSSFERFPNRDFFLKSVKTIILSSSGDYKFSFHDNKAKISLQQLINDIQPDIIHSHLYEAEIASRSIIYPKANWYSHCHDNIHQFENFNLKTIFSKKLLLNFLEKKYLFWRYKKNGGNHFIAISKDTEGYFKKKVFPFPITLLPNAISLERFQLATLKEPPTKTLRLINIGSMVDKKNQLFLIEVSNILKNKKVDFELILLGDGKNKFKIENKIKEYSLSKNITIQGNVNNVEDYLFKSDIYVHSATYEPFGLVFLEAMAAGLPSVCLDGRGNRDIIKQGFNGFIISNSNPQIFAEKIIELAQNKELYKEVSNNSLEFVKEYDIRLYVKKLIQLYKEQSQHF